MKKTILFSFLIFSVFTVFGQVTVPDSDTLRKNALNVFMSASDYVKKEIPFVNYVRDIRDAGVYIISTTQGTGSGGREYTYFLVGQNDYAGMRDTISFVTSPDDTEDEIRVKEVKTLKMGLMRYIARTPLSQYMDIKFTAPLSETVSSDKWNSWVFRARMNGYLQGEKTYKGRNIFGNLSATRVTEKWKINLRGNLSSSIDKFDVDTTSYSSENKSESVSLLVVRSITDHWSYGGSFFAGSSTYNNEKFSWRFMPGIEYDIFPYSESTRRQLRILYSLGYEYVNYNDSTIFDVLHDGNFLHSINIAYEVVQKWGSIDMSLNYRNYLYSWSLNNLSLRGYMNFRIMKGLTVNFGGGASLIHDQLGLVKGGASTEQILLRRRELATSFDYFISFGFTYTFGSIYNNVVNPRFGSIGGGGMTIMMD